MHADMLDFIGIPANATVSITNDSEVFGDFRCATRLNLHPLWIVNGVSSDIIKNTDGYGGLYLEYIPLPGEGNLLSFISIPASPATNNSVIVCGALSNGTIIANSKPAYLTGKILQHACMQVSSCVTLNICLL